jgi:DNA-binding NarL/FixJ family response regulator
MAVIVYTTSSAFRAYIHGVLDDQAVRFSSVQKADSLDPANLHLLHISSLEPERVSAFLRNQASRRVCAICSDKPNIGEMLEYIQAGIRGYCNSYMQTVHYEHLIRLLSDGHSWFPPHLLEQTFSLARHAINGANQDRLKALTSRERDVALSVAKGLTNRQIAEKHDISERTVKTHLTNIFKKLQIKDRVGLVLYLK